MGSPYGSGLSFPGAVNLSPFGAGDAALTDTPSNTLGVNSPFGAPLPAVQAAMAQQAPQQPAAPAAPPVDPTDSTVQKAASTGAPQTPAQQVAHQSTSWDNQSGNLDPVARMQALNGADASGAVNFIKAGHGTLDPRNDNWCAAFTNSALGQSGITGTNSNIASDFMNWGNAVTDPSQIQRNDVMVGKYSYRDGSLVQPGSLGSHVGVATGQTRNGDNGLELQMVSGNTEHGHVATTWEPASNFVIRRAGQPVQGTPTGNAPTGGFETPLGSSAPYADLINTAAKKYNMDPKLVQAVIAGESSGNPRAVSGPGATGLMQIMPENYGRLGITDPTDPAQNIMGGTQALSEAIQHQGGNVQNGLKEYFAGPDQSKWGTKTANYPGYILSHYNGAVPSAYAQQGGKPVSNIASMFPNQSSGTNQPTDETQTPGVSGLRNFGLANSMGGQSPLLAQLLGGKGLSSLLNGDGPFSGGNTSRTLAAMSSGFFSGKTPMQSLAGGFGALAKGMQSDQEERLGVVKQLLANQGELGKAQALYQMQLPGKASETMASLVRGGMPPTAAANMAFTGQGLAVPAQFQGDSGAAMDANYKKFQPLSSGIEKQLNDIGSAAAAASANGFKAGTYADALHKGEAGGGFNLDGVSRLKYGAENSQFNITGIQSNAAQQYNGFQSTKQQMANDALALQHGPASDQRAANALAAVQGQDLNSNAVGEAHMRMQQAASSLQYRAAFNKYNQTLKEAQKDPVTPEQFDQLFSSKDPMAGVSNDDVMKQLAPSATGQGMGDGNAAPSAPAAPAGATTLTTPSGANVQYTPPSQ